MSANKRYTNQYYLNFFQSRLSDLGADSALKYRRTLSELDCFLTGHSRSLTDLSDVMVTDWAIELFRKGLAKSTVIRHLNILNSLLKSAAKHGIIEPNDAPRKLAHKLDEHSPTLPPLMDELIFEKCLSVLRNAAKSSGTNDPYADMTLISILNGALPFGKIALLKKDDARQYAPLSRSVLERHLSPKRKLIFDLRQSYLTPTQLYDIITQGIQSVFGHILRLNELDPDSLVRSLWAACAMRCGATASEALSLLPGDTPYAIPPFCNARHTSSADKSAWIRTVSSLLTHTMPRWYAMHLRRGVQYEELRKEITESIRPTPELFYPCEKIRKHRGGRIVIQEQPFISNTAFFRTSPESVMPMFRTIGDKAWCYRTSNAPHAPYAVISQSDMRRFQTAVGIFTPDTEIHPLGGLSPKPGESVIVVTMGYGNRQGKIEEIINKDCGSVIFRVKLSTDQGYEWRMDVDPRQIERIINS